MTNISIDSFLSYTIGIIVFFIGVTLTKRFKTLQEYNIPEPVIGGLLAALIIYGFYIFSGIEIGFDLSTRDRLLVYFSLLLVLVQVGIRKTAMKRYSWLTIYDYLISTFIKD